MAIFTNENGKWMRENHACPVADPDKWSDESKQEFLRYLGISGMSSPLKNLELATERNIGVFEFRFNEANDCSRSQLAKASGIGGRMAGIRSLPPFLSVPGGMANCWGAAGCSVPLRSHWRWAVTGCVSKCRKFL